MLNVSRIAGLAAVAMLAMPELATAKNIPAFARKYGVSCSLCHAPVPRLTAFGEKFAANGFEMLPGEPPRDTINTGDPLLRLQNTLPLAIRMDMYAAAYSHTRPGQSAADLQTPWVIKLLSGGQVADKISYYAYFLLTERGEVAGLEDAYVQFTDVANTGVSVIVGQFQVSDPIFKRELRLSYEDYQQFRVRVGEASPDLTYDRGVMAMMSPWEGGDVSVQLINGHGLNTADVNRQFDRNTPKNVVLRLSQKWGPVRVGGLGYHGDERSSGYTNTIAVYGPDATVELGSIGTLNAQFLRRLDSDPFYGSCSSAVPCPGDVTTPYSTTVDAAFAEATFWPNGPTSRLYFTSSYNWVYSSRPVISLRLGEQASAPGYMSKYNAVSGGAHYWFRRNVRLMGELGYDFQREQGRLIAGTVLAF